MSSIEKQYNDLEVKVTVTSSNHDDNSNPSIYVQANAAISQSQDGEPENGLQTPYEPANSGLLF